MEIWKTYHILVQIAEQKAESAENPSAWKNLAREYRRKSQKAYCDFSGNTVVIKEFAQGIFAACAAIQNQRLYPGVTKALAEVQATMRREGWTKLADALGSLNIDESDPQALLERLDFQDALIFETIRQGIADPASLDWLRKETKQAIL